MSIALRILKPFYPVHVSAHKIQQPTNGLWDFAFTFNPILHTLFGHPKHLGKTLGIVTVLFHPLNKLTPGHV